MKNNLSKLRQSLLSEKWLLLFCFFLGFLSWQGIRKSISLELPVSNIAVDVDIPEDWAVWEKSINKINVLFAGSKEDIRYLNNEQLRINIPINEPVAGKQLQFEVKEKYLNNPTRAKVIAFSPPEIFIKLDQKQEISLPVKANITGALPEGIEIDKIICTPASINVSGAKQVLSKMINIQTEPINLKDRQSSFKISVPVALPQSSRMQVDPEWVSVDFILAQRNSSETFVNVPVRILSSAGKNLNITAFPKTVDITIQGKKQRIEQFKTADLFAYIDCSELTESASYELPVHVDLPDGLQLISSDPAIIRIDFLNKN